MAPESFFKNRLSGGDLGFNIIQRQKREREKGHNKSLLHVLADELIDVGKGSLCSAGVAYGDPRKAGVFQNQFKDGLGAVCLGVTIIHLERVLIGEPFYLRDYVSDIESGGDGTPWGISVSKEFHDFSTESIPLEKLQEMWDVSKEDRTLAIFFEKKGILPVTLEKLIKESGSVFGPFYSNIVQVLPVYKKLAQSALNGIES